MLLQTVWTGDVSAGWEVESNSKTVFTVKGLTFYTQTIIGIIKEKEKKN